MSEHTPLTEAEREALLRWVWQAPTEGTELHAALCNEVERILAARTSTATEPEVVGDGCACWVTPEHMWLSAASCGYGGGYEPGSQVEFNPDCPKHGTSTATADTEALRRAVVRETNLGLDDFRMGRASNDALAKRMLDAIQPFLAAADTGLRERVEALADEWSTPESHREGAWIRHRDAADRLRDLLATPASTEDRYCTEHDPVYDRTIYECGHAHGYCRHCGETTEPCPPTEDRAHWTFDALTDYANAETARANAAEAKLAQLLEDRADNEGTR